MVRELTFRRILVATDLSAGSDAVIEAAIAFGRAFDASIELVHVATPFLFTLFEVAEVDAQPAPGPAKKRRDERIDARLAKQSSRARAAGLACVTTSLAGWPTRQILAHVRKVRADLIVVGISADVRLGHLIGDRVGVGLARRRRKDTLAASPGTARTSTEASESGDIIDLRRNSAALCAVATIWDRQRFRRIAPKWHRAWYDRRPAQIDDRVQGSHQNVHDRRELVGAS